VKVKDLIEELQKLNPEWFIEPTITANWPDMSVTAVHLRVGPKNPGYPWYIITEKEIAL